MYSFSRDGELGLQKIDKAIIVIIIPLKDKSVGTSEKKKIPKIIADIGSPPAAKIAAFEVSIYFKDTVYKIYGKTEVHNACKIRKAEFSIGESTINDPRILQFINGSNAIEQVNKL